MSRLNPKLKSINDEDGKFLSVEVFDQRDLKSKQLPVNKLSSVAALTDIIADKVSKGGDVILGDLTIGNGIIVIERSGLGLLMKGLPGEQAPLQIFYNPDASVNQRYTKVGVRDALIYSVESDSDTGLGTGNNVKLITVDVDGLTHLPNGGIDIQGQLIKKVTSSALATLDSSLNDNNVFLDTTSNAIAYTLQAEFFVEGKERTIIDTGGNAAANNITISTVGAQTINGAATYVINANYGKVCIVSDGTNAFIKHT